MLMNISVPLLGAVDTAVVGHLDEVFYLGAVSIGSLIFSVLYWGFGFFRMSTVGLAAQAHGAGEEREVINILARAVILGLAVGVTCVLLRAPIVTLAFSLIDASTQVRQYGIQYFEIRVWAAPAVFVSMVFTGWFYGVKNVAYPVALTVGVNALNVALNLWFVVGMGMKSDGVAIATVIAQYSGLVATVGLFAYRYRNLLPHLSLAGVVARDRVSGLMRTNGDIFVRTIVLLFAHALFMAQSAKLGDVILAANTILLQFRFLSAHAMDGFATAAEVLVGSAVGSGKREELMHAIRLSRRWGLVAGAAISSSYLVLSPWLPELFTANPEVLAVCHVFILWVVLDPLLSNFAFIFDGIYIGATGTRTMRNTMLISVFLFYIPAFVVLGQLFGNHGMWAATLLLYAVRGLTLAIPLRRLKADPSYRLV